MFRFQGLPVAPFKALFALDDGALAARGIRRLIADEKPGFPCRVSLVEAEPGERVLLLAYEHQPARSPYRASGPIFVREAATAPYDGTQVPEVLRPRMLSVRAYDVAGLMVDAAVEHGENIEAVLTRLFTRADTDYVHIHNAGRGCFACRAERA